MTSFTEQLAIDAAVFLNPDEFGEEHVIDGVTIVCVVDDSGTAQFSGADGALYLADLTLIARTSDLAAMPHGMPKADRTLTVGEKSYMVLHVADEMGMATVRMQNAGS